MNELLSSILAVQTVELDAEGPSDVGWVSVEDYSSFMALVMRSVGTGGLDDFRILGNTVADGSGTDVVLKDYANVGTLANVNAVGDQAMLEVRFSHLQPPKYYRSPATAVR